MHFLTADIQRLRFEAANRIQRKTEKSPTVSYTRQTDLTPVIMREIDIYSLSGQS